MIISPWINNMRFILIVLFCLIFPGKQTLYSQPAHFDHYSVANGLVQSVILDIYQDSGGFIWLGTQSGLSRFDGYSFKNFVTDPLRRQTLSNTWIYDIAEGPDGNIYVATKGGLNCYDRKTGNFSIIPHKSPDCPIKDNFIYGLASDKDHLYINTPRALSILSFQDNSLESYYNNFKYDGAIHDVGSPLLLSSKKELWIATRRGLFLFDSRNKDFIEYPRDHESPEFPGSRQITCIYEDLGQKILVGTQNGVYRVDQKNRILIRQTQYDGKLSNIFIRDIIRDPDGYLWIATQGGGLNRISLSMENEIEDIQYFTSDRGFVSHDILYRLLIDRSENLWVGTLAGVDKTDLKETGISLIANSEDPMSYNLLDNVIASVYEDDTGNLWIGNWGKGLNIIQKESGNIIHYTESFPPARRIPENHVHIIKEDLKGRIWIGTRSGVSVYEPQSTRFIPIHEYFDAPEFDCFSGIRIYSMEQDRKGYIWMGTGNGIYILDLKLGKVRRMRSESNNRMPEILSNQVYSVMEDRAGNIWIATSRGLNSYDPNSNTMQSFTNNPDSANSLGVNFTISLLEDRAGNIWIGTGSGLNRFRPDENRFDFYAIEQGLPSDIIYDIIEDTKGRVWFSTGSGVAYTENPDDAKPVINIIDHLKGLEFNIRAVYQSDNGQLYFGSMQGVHHFHPDSLELNPHIPPVEFSYIRKESGGVIEEMVASTDSVILDHEDYSFTAEFSALDFTSVEKNQYQYRLKGLSDRWIDLGTRNFVHFTNLRHGNYLLQVKGTNNNGVMNPEPAALFIIKKPPWWYSNYAYASYVILAILLVILITYLREKRLKTEKRILEKKVKQRTREIARQKEIAEESEQKLSSTINSLDDLVFVLDHEGKFQEFYNPRKRQTHLIFPELHRNKHYRDVGLTGDILEHLDHAYQVLENSDEIIDFDHRIKDKGAVFWFNTRISPKRSPDGRLTGIVIVARDINDRKESEEMLARQKEELDELNATKDRFFSILAHDLKNPFTNLYSMGDLLQKNYELLDESDRYEAIRKMFKSTEYIYNLLENLLTWSRTQRGKIEFQPTSFDLNTSIDTILNIHKLAAENKSVTLNNNLKGSMKVYADRQMIDTVLRNLISNAVKFTGKEGHIEVNADQENGHAHVEIKDTGKGIPAEKQKNLFRLDVKFSTTGTAGETGTGLGLILCREFILKNNGKIWFKSSEGKGTSFFFTIPVSSRQIEK